MRLGSAALIGVSLPSIGAPDSETVNSISDMARQFHSIHLVCDMLGLNLNHPRILIDNVDLGKRHDDTSRGDFVKLKDWGLTLVMCKGGPGFFSSDYEALWRLQPEWRPGNPEPLHLTLAMKNPTQLLMANLDRFLGQVDGNSDKVLLVRRPGDIERARSESKIALVMGANRSDWFGDSPGVIRMLARLGLRMITIAQGTRELGYDAYNETRSGGRMTELGARMIHEMNRWGILVDISHLNDPCALDAIEVSERPVVASHSNPRALDGSMRNMPDSVMKALAKRGGVLGLMPPISRPNGERPLQRVAKKEIEKTLAMIRYAIDTMGVDSVGIGTHFNTTAMLWVTDGLLSQGFSERDTEKIMGTNYLRLLRQVLPT